MLKSLLRTWKIKIHQIFKHIPSYLISKIGKYLLLLGSLLIFFLHVVLFFILYGVENILFFEYGEFFLTYTYPMVLVIGVLLILEGIIHQLFVKYSLKSKPNVQKNIKNPKKVKK